MAGPTIASAFKTPPATTRRRLHSTTDAAVGSPPPKSKSSSPLCYSGACALIRLVRDAFAQEARQPHLDEKLDLLAAKIDVIAKQISQESDVKVKERERSKAVADAERAGIEVARYSQIPQFDASILDTYIPRCRRMTQLHFGHIVSNPHAPMAFTEKMGYNMTYNLVPPGNGNALHMHRSIEIFVALDGKWEIAWGMQGENKVMLEPWDFVSVPARVCHAYKNIEEQTAQNIMTILPGKSWITWAPDVVAEARKNGAVCDDNGVLLKYAHLMAPTKDLASSAEDVEWRSMGPEDMKPYLHRFRDGIPLECRMGTQVAEDGKSPFIEIFWKTVKPDSSISLPLRPGVDLLLVVLDGSIMVKTGNGMPVAAAGRLDAVRVPIDALAMDEVVISNPCPSTCTLLVTASQLREENDLYFHLC